jgi:uncharacterized repeat protein (TIGR03803 family)
MDSPRQDLSRIFGIMILCGAVLVGTQSAWAQTFTVLHSFTGGGDGSAPIAGVTRNVAGDLYGTASSGGAGHGTVYKLTNKNGNWIFAPLYKFTGGSDGSGPSAGVVIGSNGTLYGTTSAGGSGCGASGCGTVFNLAISAQLLEKV